jgi:glutamine synthetase
MIYLAPARPVKVVPDPIRGDPHVIVMTEVLAQDGSPHETNTRAQLAAIVDDAVLAEKPWYGLEQEYTMLAKGSQKVYGWPNGGYPAPQVSTRPWAGLPGTFHCRTVALLGRDTWARPSASCCALCPRA